MQFVKGPDFPTGGLILGPGRHHRRLPHRPGLDPACAAKAEIEERHARPIADRRHRAAVPGQPTRSIAGRIKELVDAGELEGIADVNDESAGGKTGIGHHAEARRQRQRRCSTTSTSSPRCRRASRSTWWPWSTACPARSTCATGARGLHRPPGRGHHPPLASSGSTKAQDRAHIVEGLLKALDVIDEIIAPIRASRRPGRRPAPR